jgi:hypothetical protein
VSLAVFTVGTRMVLKSWTEVVGLSIYIEALRDPE